MKLVIIGGVAAGASAAARARRMDERAEIIVFEAGGYVSFANCGLPYHIGGDIPERGSLLLVSPEMFMKRFHIDVRIRHLVTGIDRARKTLTVRSPDGVFEETYDKLILAPGCEPVKPPIEGIGLPGVSTVFTIDDVDRICAALELGAKRAVVVGGGFIGIETAEALIHRGLDTTLVEAAPQLMPGFDAEFSKPMERHLAAAGLKLRLNTSVREFRGEQQLRAAVLADGTVLEADLVIVAAGLRPRTELARSAGLALGETGGIRTDEYMRTSDPDIYAAGDAVETYLRVTGAPIRVALASNANRQGRIAGDHAVGSGKLSYRGTLATSVIRVWDLTAACTGISERDAKKAGLDYYSVFAPSASNAAYFPGSGWLILKLIAERGSGRILGAQAIGERGVDKCIDVIATAIFAGLTVCDLEDLDLAYAPPYSSSRGPAICAGMVAANVLRGDVKTVAPTDLSEFLEQSGARLIDIREPGELSGDGEFPGAVNIPMDQLRADPFRLSPDEKYVIACGVGKRGHNTCRFLSQLGFDVYNLTGGYNAYAMDV